MTEKKILLVDDDTDIVEIVRQYLTKEGFEVLTSHHGIEALEHAKSYQPDLIILDIVLPGVDGMEICRQLRKNFNTPILFLSGKRDDEDIILGLDAGGDDYITKPFSPNQLVARVKAHLRRNHMLEQKEESQLLSFPGFELDLLNRTVKVNESLVTLSAKEFDLLLYLAKKPNQTIGIERLYNSIWGVDSNGDTRTLLVHISNLRKKIEADPNHPKYVVTVRGIGYKFNA